jgi:hypothetical protein
MSSNPRLTRAIRNIHRRTFLKAVGLGLSAPAALRMARMATAATTVAPKRFFLFYMPHGIAPEHYNPKVSASDPTDFALDQTNLSILGPFQGLKQYVNVYQGMQYVGAADTHEGIVNCLTGSDVKDTTTSRISVEQVIAKGLGVKPLILGACSHQPYGLDLHGMLFWNGTPIDPEKSPVKAADSLFGGAGPTQPVNADVQLRQDLLALTASEIQEVTTSLNGLTTQQSKLQAHLKAIQELQATSSTGTGKSSCSSKPNLPSVEMVRAASAGQVVDPSGGNDYFYQEKNFPLLLKAQLEVVTQAMICNAAQVIALMPMYATCDFDFSFAGAPGSHHNGLSHTFPGTNNTSPYGQYNSPISVDNYLAATRAPFAKAQLWFSQQLASMVNILATTDDPAAPGTKVLDNSLIFWMSEIGDGQGHNRLSMLEYPQVPASLPLVTIGKCGGALKTGRVVQFPVDTQQNAAMTNRPAADLYLTMSRAMGVSTATFPGTTGAITEVLS